MLTVYPNETPAVPPVVPQSGLRGADIPLPRAGGSLFRGLHQLIRLAVPAPVSGRWRRFSEVNPACGNQHAVTKE